MTARIKKHLSLIGVVITVGSVAGAITAVLIAWSTLKAKAQHDLVLPVVREQVALASEECKKEISESKKDRIKYQEKQEDVNKQILEFLHRLDKTTGRLETELKYINQNNRR